MRIHPIFIMSSMLFGGFMGYVLSYLINKEPIERGARSKQWLVMKGDTVFIHGYTISIDNVIHVPVPDKLLLKPTYHDTAIYLKPGINYDSVFNIKPVPQHKKKHPDAIPHRIIDDDYSGDLIPRVRILSAPEFDKMFDSIMRSHGKVYDSTIFQWIPDPMKPVIDSL